MGRAVSTERHVEDRADGGGPDGGRGRDGGAAVRAPGLIDPRFTPVHLARQSDAVEQLKGKTAAGLCQDRGKARLRRREARG